MRCCREIAEQEDAELIVLGSRGHGPVRAALQGSVSAGVAANAPCPVVVVSAGLPVRETADETTIVCGLDDSEGARAALRVAGMLSGWLDARLVLTHVVPPPHVPGAPTMPGAREQLREVELERGEALLAALADEARLETYAELRAVLGPPAPGLAEFAAQERAYLVVVGCRGRSPLKAALLGSVSQELIRLAPCPVVVVPPALARAHGRPVADTAGVRS